MKKLERYSKKWCFFALLQLAQFIFPPNFQFLQSIYSLAWNRTNTDLPADQVYDNCQQLWNVERAFRITKGTLEVRPMFHFSEKRIEAHVCICFVALKVYKELERLLKISGCPYSVDNVLRIAEVIVTIEVDLPENGKTLTKTIYTSKEERDIAYLIETDDWLNKNG